MGTIKCPYCDVKSSYESWDEATQEVYGDDSEQIELVVVEDNASEPADLYWFACPACSEDNIAGDTLQDAQDDMEDEE